MKCRNGVTIEQDLDACQTWVYENTKDDAPSDNNARLGGDERGLAVVLTIGSHWPSLGYPDTMALGRELLQYAREAQGMGRDICLVVLPTFDSEYEHIPSTFDFNQRAARNTWRLRAVAEALREVLAQKAEEDTKEGGARVRVHMLDVFSPSAALHFSAHHRHDPVHFNRRFYDWMVGAIHTAVTELCADRPDEANAGKRDFAPCPKAKTWEGAGNGKALWGLCAHSHD
jgi:hypothetical protein